MKRRYSQCNIRSSTNFGRGSIILWGGITLRSPTELVPLHGEFLTADFSFHPIYLVMNDNARRPHVARKVTEYLQGVNFKQASLQSRLKLYGTCLGLSLQKGEIWKCDAL